MATYKLVQPYTAPLLLQITAPSTVKATVTRIAVNGIGAAGKASRIYVYRPSSPGTGSGVVRALYNNSPVSQVTGITSFASPPSIPLFRLNSGLLLPITVEWSGEIVVQGNSLVVFQDCQDTYGAEGEIEWEESMADL